MPTVMVVDDAGVQRETLSRLLRREGYEAVGAADGGEALRLLGERTPDLMILDVNMPGMDGLDLLETLHRHPQWRALPVIMLTAVADTHTVRRCEQLGAKDYMVKATFSLADMLHHVKAYTRYLPQ